MVQSWLIDSLANLRISTDIPANSNLNNFTALGIYSCGSTASATSVTNNPCGNAFYLEVVSVSPGTGGAWIGRLQILTEYRGSAVYIRRASTDGNGSWGFTGWYKYTGTAV